MEKEMLAPILALMLLFSSAAIIQSNTDRKDAMQERVQESVVLVKSIQGGHGSGWITKTKSGRTAVVTNQHVCDMSPIPFMELVTSDGKEHVGLILERSDEHDLCLIAAPKGYPELEVADKALNGETVFIVGYPLIEYMTVTSGKLKGTEVLEKEYPLPPELCKAKKFSVKPVLRMTNNGPVLIPTCFFKANVYVTTANTDGGASGSPLLNEYGEVVGVVMLRYGNISWAASVDLPSLKKFLNEN